MFYSISSIFEEENIGEWYNYIYSLTSKDNLLLANDYNFKKSLFIFWRLIANNLDSNTTFKIGFKVLFKISNKDKEEILSKEKVIQEGQDVFIIRTISPIQVVVNKNFEELYEVLLDILIQCQIITLHMKLKA